MIAVVQRVSSARVRVDGECVGEIERGMLVLLGVLRGDRGEEASKLAERVARLRFFEDAEGKMNLSALDARVGALVVSQFTLAADLRKGRRPSFDRASPPDEARALYERFVAELRALGLATATGRFGARMSVELVNHGPVTFVVEEPPPTSPC